MFNCSPDKIEIFFADSEGSRPPAGLPHRLSLWGVLCRLTPRLGWHQCGEVAGPGRPGGGMAVLETPLLQAVESPNLSFTHVKAKL